MSILDGNYTPYIVPDSTFDLWNGKRETTTFASPYVAKSFDYLNDLVPSVNSGYSLQNGASNLPSNMINFPTVQTPAPSALLQSAREDPSNQVITDVATGDDNQGYFEGLPSSVGEMEKQQMSYNERMTKALMEWYEHMSNTSYQRAMADMKAAGLNPILAYSQGGASTPSVHPMTYSMGGGDTLTDFVNMITSGASNLLRAIASFLPGQQADKLLEVSKELSYNKKGKLESVTTSNTYG